MSDVPDFSHPLQGRQRHRPPRDSLRLFVALYPMNDAASAIADSGLALLRLLGGNTQHRPVPTDQIHLTLLFLGNRPARDLDHVTESITHATAGIPAFELHPTSYQTFPTTGRDARTPRLLACITDAPPPLLELRRRLVARLANNPRSMRENQRFLPHFTLARFTHTARASPFSHPVQPDSPQQPIRIEHVHLVRSTLTSDGARHTPVATFPLSPAIDTSQ